MPNYKTWLVGIPLSLCTRPDIGHHWDRINHRAERKRCLSNLGTRKSRSSRCFKYLSACAPYAAHLCHLRFGCLLLLLLLLSLASLRRTRVHLKCYLLFNYEKNLIQDPDEEALTPRVESTTKHVCVCLDRKNMLYIVYIRDAVG